MTVQVHAVVAGPFPRSDDAERWCITAAEHMQAAGVPAEIEGWSGDHGYMASVTAVSRGDPAAVTTALALSHLARFHQ